jgi:peptidyl-prolyl cis-trans isomerase C
VAATFGAELARVAMTAPERRWSEPVVSPYGWHLVQVEARTEERLPPLDAIRGQVRYAWRSDHARQAVAAAIRDLRERYRVEIAASPAPGAPAPRPAGG